MQRSIPMPMKQRGAYIPLPDPPVVGEQRVSPLQQSVLLQQSQVEGIYTALHNSLTLEHYSTLDPKIGKNITQPWKKILSGYQSKERRMSSRDNQPHSTATDHCHLYRGQVKVSLHAPACITNQALLSRHYKTSNRFLFFFNQKSASFLC